MKNKGLFINILSVLLVLIVPLITYGFNFISIAFDQDLYTEEFSKYNVYENLRNYDIENINNDVLNYLTNRKINLIESDFFNQREKTHLLDVKILIQKVLTIYYYSIILFLLLFILLTFLYNYNFKLILKRILIILLNGSLLTVLYTGLFFILSYFNFNFVFDLFHKTFFSPGTFTFNPAFENIVVLYPQDLFFDFLINIVSNTILSSVVIFFFSVILFLGFFKSNFIKFFKNLRREK